MDSLLLWQRIGAGHDTAVGASSLREDRGISENRRPTGEAGDHSTVRTENNQFEGTGCPPNNAYVAQKVDVNYQRSRCH